MIGFFLTICKLLKADSRSSADPEFRALAIISVALLLSGSLFYSYVEERRLLDSF